jgi:hypothetical protein
VVLDPLGASMPTLRTVPGGGFLLAYEKKIPRVGNIVRLRYYRSPAQLQTGHFAAQRDLPHTFSPYNDGTPTILSVTWHHALARSVIHIGFHYETEARGTRGPDREAIGTLVDFKRWTAHPEKPLDLALDRQGLSGSHGDWRQFSFAGDRWRIYEGQGTWDNFGSWRVVLQDTSTGQLYPLTLSSDAQAVSGSVANPVVAVLPAPGGSGQVPTRRARRTRLLPAAVMGYGRGRNRRELEDRIGTGRTLRSSRTRSKRRGTSATAD